MRVVIFCKCAGIQGEEEYANVKKSSCARKRVLSVVKGEILQRSIALDHLKIYSLETHQSCIYYILPTIYDNQSHPIYPSVQPTYSCEDNLSIDNLI